MPSYPPDERDLRTFRLAGLELPVRSTVVVVAVILLVIFDFQRTIIPDELVRYDRNPGMQRLQALSRVALFFCIPLLMVYAKFATTLPNLFRGAIFLAISGGLYRFDTFLTAFNPGPGWHYFPSVSELFITLGLVALEVAVYVALVRFFPILTGDFEAAN